MQNKQVSTSESEKNISYSEVTNYVLRQAKGKYLIFFGIIILVFIQTFLEVMMPYLTGNLIDFISSNPSVDENILKHSFKLLFYIALTGLAFWTIHIGTHLIYDTFFKFPIMGNAIQKSFYKVQRFGTDWHANNFAGAIVAKIRRGTSALHNYLDLFYNSFIPLVFLLCIMTVFLFIKWKIMGLFFAISSIIYALFSIGLTAKYVSPIARLSAQQDTKYGATLADAISCNATVKAFGQEEKEDANFGKVIKKWIRLFWKRYTINNIIALLQNYLMTTIKISLFGLAIWFWIKGEATVGDLVFVIATYNVLQGHLRQIGERIKELQQSVNDMEEMVEYDISEIQVKNKLKTKNIKIKKGEIEFKNVNFIYPNQKQEIFSNFSLKIKAGEKVALVGHSGSGKTTFIKLLQRLYDIQGGVILIDGKNIANVTQESLRENIALVPQEPILFHRTLSENIAYAKPNSSEEDIFRAARLSHSHNFIKNLPKKYETLVGERGIKLSGGERQRVAIARAILADSLILILDEATSSLDSISEKFIQDSIHRLMRNRTSIIIAHRLSTIKKVDRILVFKDGNVVEQGTHRKLLAIQNGTYKKLYTMQAGGFIG